MTRIAHLFRHPVKGLGSEALTTADLPTGKGIPGDRRWALAHAKSPFDADAPEFISRRHFVQTADNPVLAQTTTSLSGTTIAVGHPLAEPLMADLATDAGAEALTTWAAHIGGSAQPGPYRLATLPQQALWDVSNAHVSLMSLTALEILSQKVGQSLEMHRFRGNIWLEGLAPGEEFEMVGREFTLGTARLRITEPNTRCMSPSASPATGLRDVPVTERLHAFYGHMDFGIYAEVIEGGTITIGDTLA